MVSLSSAVFVERADLRAGVPVRALEPARNLSHGDRVVTLINWTRRSGSGGFTVVNAVPAAMVYQRSADGDEEVSVDGATWGKLPLLHVGSRPAVPEDVTRLRWHVSAQQSSGGSGSVAYAGFVR